MAIDTMKYDYSICTFLSILVLFQIVDHMDHTDSWYVSLEGASLRQGRDEAVDDDNVFHK